MDERLKHLNQRQIDRLVEELLKKQQEEDKRRQEKVSEWYSDKQKEPYTAQRSN